MSAWSPNEPFNGLPALADSIEIDVASLSSALIEARVQLARLDELAKALAKPMVLVNAIAIVEAQASSAIENIVTTNDTLFQNFEASGGIADADTRAAMRNRSALQMAYKLTIDRPITTKLAQTICSEILGFDVSVRANVGTYIGSLGKRTYTPPEGKALIARKLEEWQDFVNQKSRFDPLIVMALAHYQFEAIHPFPDGNGRTGRILNIAMLMQNQLLSLPVVHLSRAINERKSEYSERLAEVTSARNWNEWVRFMLEVVASSAIKASAQISQISRMQLELAGSHIDTVFKRGIPTDLAAVLFEKPYCRIGHVVEACNVSRPTSAKWLEELEILGVVESVKVGREKYFVNRKMLEVLS